MPTSQDRDSLIEQSDRDTLITVVLLEILQWKMHHKLLREEYEGWWLFFKSSTQTGLALLPKAETPFLDLPLNKQTEHS